MHMLNVTQKNANPILLNFELNYKYVIYKIMRIFGSFLLLLED